MSHWSFYAQETHASHIRQKAIQQDGFNYTPFSPPYPSLEAVQHWLQQYGVFFLQRGVVLKLFINRKLQADVLCKEGRYELAFRSAALAEKYAAPDPLSQSNP